MALEALFTIFALCTLTARSSDVPVIGILSLPCLPQIAAHDCPSWTGVNATSYFAASYVKFLEAGGAKVVPIFVTDSAEEVSELVLQLNGVLFTGGTEYFNSTSTYYSQVKNILSTLRRFHAENPSKSIPLWGTCLGFQAIVCAVSKTGPSILGGGYDVYNTPLAVNFTDYAKTARMFSPPMPSSYSSSVYAKMENEALTENHHGGGFDPTDFAADAYLAGNFSNIGNSYSAKSGKHFVTLIESQSQLGLSWYGSQFHPEKPQYEFTTVQGVHSLDSVFVNQYLTEFFVNECRIKNDNAMDAELLQSKVIYNYEAYFVDKDGQSAFEQNYLFV